MCVLNKKKNIEETFTQAKSTSDKKHPNNQRANGDGEIRIL